MLINEAGKAFRRICDDVKAKYGLQLAVVYQYNGSFGSGEILVMFMMAAKARPETFAALEDVVCRFKPEGNLRKKEICLDGESGWIEK